MQNEDLPRSEAARDAEAERISQRICELRRRLEILRTGADGAYPEKARTHFPEPATVALTRAAGRI